MKKELLLSFIIPVYNVENYLRECVDSVLHAMTDMCELILVNDGSLDSSGDICTRYAENDRRVRVIQQKNGGLSAARNTGLSAASGRYVTFIDSDDKIYPESIVAILNWIVSSGADLCFLQAESDMMRAVLFSTIKELS